ncbi:16S rRNA (cytidine(1402)-2'-O)-methyltransferase [Natranaerobius thermophilus]|uniref:Ribosomal RNA small subunit methyltransferase I n=1 Tax=Natranaerobius thermophilus (strain ATCC BAA-1301 / DSM 18059 / JW/NM-WN-LF) TaxID=457570 RepID=B2A328_NATTJ|nr:16S rRNA (cytidine(1402)-2'-O)-methyltransferase [Natranaerobius thermophilus]ACB83640.1 Uroporphyrin-III C/tetrapyrrole (Corrin/Porphyrin) methyltransferase [Natranaerobius thermophilus JW/NM-WN-LF]
MGNNTKKGKLFLCPTPIGNLRDITLRVIDCLKEVNLVACEDTRRTKKLLNHLEINVEMLSYHKFNQESRGQQIIEKLLQGMDVALVSDAGTPSISDPGKFLVQEAIQKEIEVIALPGPSAPITALAGSGLDTDSFMFLGYIPEKGIERKDILAEIIGSAHTVILYENYNRLEKTINDLSKQLGKRQIVIAKELTKVHEQYIRGTAKELLEYLEKNSIKGECTVLIQGANHTTELNYLPGEDAKSHLNELIGQGFTKKQAIKLVSQLREIPKREVYQIALELEKEK